MSGRCAAGPARLALAGLVALMMATLGAAGVATAAEITWKRSALFERYSHDEDIRDILRNVLRQNGTDVVFSAGVGGTITYRFQRIPLQGAFNMLIGQNDLLYRFDADSNTVYVRTPGDKPVKRKPKRRRRPKQTKGFAAVQHTDGKQIIAAARRLGLGGSIIMDPTGRTAIIKGTVRQVRSIMKLIKRQETAARARKVRAATKAATKVKAAARAKEEARAKTAARAKAAARAKTAAKAKAASAKAKAKAAARAKTAAKAKAAIEATGAAKASARQAARRKPPPPKPKSPPVIVAKLAPPRAALDIDLSYIYRLTGVGKVGSGSRMAILNGKDYRVGDEIDGMEIIVISDDLVRLAQRTESGMESYVVRIRKAAKAERPKSEPAAARPAVDLTAKYKLSGIGEIGGKHFAVLDGKDYAVGDSLSQLTIVRIAGDRVLLEKATKDGRRSYVIKFRIRKKN